MNINDQTGENAFEKIDLPSDLEVKTHSVEITSKPRLDDLFLLKKVSVEESWEVLFV